MATSVSRVDVWVASLKDRPGAVAQKLQALTEAGANLAFVIARRTEKKPGTGVLFATPISGRKQIAAAKKARFRRTKSLHSIRVEGPDKAGFGAKVTGALAEAGINLRGISAAAIGKRCVLNLAFDKSADATQAGRILKKL